MLSKAETVNQSTQEPRLENLARMGASDKSLPHSNKQGILKLPGLKPIYERPNLLKKKPKSISQEEKCALMAKGKASVPPQELSVGLDQDQEDMFTLLQMPAHYLDGVDFGADDGQSAKELHRLVSEFKKTKKSKGLSPR